MKRLQKLIPLGLVALLLLFIFPVFAYTGNGGTTVYVTETGGRYHVISCSYLRKSCYDIALEDAIIAGYTRCTVCWPPSYTGTAKPGDPKPVSDSSGSSGTTTKETQDFSWLDDWEMPTWVSPTFSPLPSETQETDRSSGSTKEEAIKRDTLPKEDRSEYISSFLIGSFIIILFTFGPATSLSDRYHSDVMHPYIISCSAPFISILGFSLFKWSVFVVAVVLIISIIIFSVSSAIYMKKYKAECRSKKSEN